MKGFTATEIMIVIVIIGLITGIAIPSYLKSREQAREDICMANLRQIDNAKQMWALAEGQDETSTPTWGDLVSEFMKKKTVCPSGGSYTIGALNTSPVCMKGGVHAKLYE